MHVVPISSGTKIANPIQKQSRRFLDLHLPANIHRGPISVLPTCRSHNNLRIQSLDMDFHYQHNRHSKLVATAQ
jgi:hypothetical protein